MVVAIVKYLRQQGYSPSNMVVLTPYLGQLLKLQEALSADQKVLVGDLDFAEAKKHLDDIAGFTIGGAAAQTEQCVRVATIDNYQGEEADIIIVSLVRSNRENSIGFLQEPERVNVMLSRARLCEIVIGNTEVLQSARRARRSASELSGGPLWEAILSHLFERDGVFGGFPAVCQTHKSQATLVNPGDFAKHCPEGGCNLPCSKALPGCWHTCPRRCHVGDCDVKCIEPVEAMCARELHEVLRTCSGAPPKCNRQVPWTCDGKEGAVHQNNSPCHSQGRKCNRCASIKKLEAETQQKEDELRKEQERWETAHELLMKKSTDDAKLARKKKRDFETRKQRELDLRKQEIETRQLEREHKLRQQYSADEIEAEVQTAQKEADRELAQAEKNFHAQLHNRAKQADENLERIEAESQEDLQRLRDENAEQERQLRQVLQASADELELQRAQTEEDRRRIQVANSADAMFDVRADVRLLRVLRLVFVSVLNRVSCN